MQGKAGRRVVTRESLGNGESADAGEGGVTRFGGSDGE